MVEVNWLTTWFSGVTECVRPCTLCRVQKSSPSLQQKTKISKQSALAVSQPFRDNQLQFTGMFKYALA